MASSTRGANEEKVHVVGARPPAAKTLLVGEEAGQRDQGVLPRVVAEESYTPNTTPGGTREEVSGRLSLPAPPPPVVNRGTEGKRQVVPGQEEHNQGPRAVEVTQGVTEGSQPARVPVSVARR